MTFDNRNHNETDSQSTEEKPNLSFVAMITIAINSSPRRMCQLSDIYKFISSNYPFYQLDNRKWQNSIRHSLSFNDCFIRIRHKSLPIHEQKSGNRGDYWTIHEGAKKMFANGGLLRRQKKFIDGAKRNKSPRSSNRSKPDMNDTRSIGSSIETKESISASTETMDQNEWNHESYPVAPMNNACDHYYYPPLFSYQDLARNYPIPYWQPIPEFYNQDSLTLSPLTDSTNLYNSTDFTYID